MKTLDAKGLTVYHNSCGYVGIIWPMSPAEAQELAAALLKKAREARKAGRVFPANKRRK